MNPIWYRVALTSTGGKDVVEWEDFLGVVLIGGHAHCAGVGPRKLAALGHAAQQTMVARISRRIIRMHPTDAGNPDVHQF